MRRQIKKDKLAYIRVATPVSRVYVYWAKMMDSEFGEGLEVSGTSCTIVSALGTGTLPCFVL